MRPLAGKPISMLTIRLRRKDSEHRQYAQEFPVRSGLSPADHFCRNPLRGTNTVRWRAQLAQQVILEGDALFICVVEKSRKCSGFAADMNADPRRSGERIALNVVDGECVARKLIGATGGFIGGIAFVIDTE